MAHLANAGLTVIETFRRKRAGPPKGVYERLAVISALYAHWTKP